MPVGKRSITSIKTASIEAVGEQGGDLLVALLKAISSQPKPVLSSYEELTKATQSEWLLRTIPLQISWNIKKHHIKQKTGWRKNDFEFDKIEQGLQHSRVHQY